MSDTEGTGIKMVELNPHRGIGTILPALGRNHQKLFIARTKAAIACHNLSDADFNGRVDLGLTFKRPDIVRAITSVFMENVHGSQPGADYSLNLPPDNTLHVDAGRKGQSGILKEALAMVRRSKPGSRIVYMSQYTPDPLVGRELSAKAAQGSPLDVYTSSTDDPKFNQAPYAHFYNRFFESIKHIPQARIRHHPNHYVHAKLLMTGLEFSGDEVTAGEAMLGSHNFVYWGVLFGTAEIAMHTTDLKLINKIYAFVRDFENQPRPI